MVSNQEEWVKLIDKEAWGIDGSHFGEVRDINLQCVITERGLINNEWFYLPKQKVRGYDNKKVIFGVTEEEAMILYLRPGHIAKEHVKISKHIIQLSREELVLERRLQNRKLVRALE